MERRIERGDIFLVNLEPISGSEQGRIRPGIVIQNNILNKLSPLIIIVPLTSKIYTKTFPTNVFISKEESRLKRDSTVLTNQIRAIDKSRIIKKLGHLDESIVKEVDLALKISLDLD